MKSLIVLSALIVAIFGAPQTLLQPTIITSASPVVSQYHSQDTLGQYSYGYNGASSAKVETKSLDGVTRGSYSYVDADGKLQTVEYSADAVNGFRAAATNLPKAPLPQSLPLGDAVFIDNDIDNPVRDTPEVAQAKLEHFRLYNEAALRAAASPEIIAPIAIRTAPNTFSYSYGSTAPSGFVVPQLIAARALPISSPVVFANGVPQDTPEVAQAKFEHLQKVEEQKARIAAAQ